LYSTCCGNYRDDDGVFLRGDVSDKDMAGGSDGPCTTGVVGSVSLSSPKLVINSTTPGADTPGDLDRDREDDILQQRRHTAVLDAAQSKYVSKFIHVTDTRVYNRLVQSNSN